MSFDSFKNVLLILYRMPALEQRLLELAEDLAEILPKLSPRAADSGAVVTSENIGKTFLPFELMEVV